MSFAEHQSTFYRELFPRCELASGGDNTLVQEMDRSQSAASSALLRLRIPRQYCNRDTGHACRFLASEFNVLGTRQEPQKEASPTSRRTAPDEAP